MRTERSSSSRPSTGCPSCRQHPSSSDWFDVQKSNLQELISLVLMRRKDFMFSPAAWFILICVTEMVGVLPGTAETNLRLHSGWPAGINHDNGILLQIIRPDAHCPAPAFRRIALYCGCVIRSWQRAHAQHAKPTKHYLCHLHNRSFRIHSFLNNPSRHRRICTRKALASGEGEIPCSRILSPPCSTACCQGRLAG